MENQSTRHQSSVWERFERYKREGTKLMRCLECGLELKTHLASNAKRHLRTVHQIVEPELDDVLERERNKSAPERLNEQLLSLFLEKQRLWLETYTVGATIAHIMIKPTGDSSEESKRQPVARMYNQEDDQKRKSRILQTRLAVSRHRSKVASTKSKMDQLQKETTISENVCDIQQFTYVLADISRPTILNRDMSVGSFIAAYLDFASGYTLKAPDSFRKNFALLFQARPRITAESGTTSGEDDLLQKCLQCVPAWRMAEGVKNALLNRHSSLLARLYNIICRSVALMYSYTQGRSNSDVVEKVSEAGGTVGYLVNPMRPRIDYLDQRSLFLIATEPHHGCRNDVVMDVFRANNAATINFNFYESCARAVPCLRNFLRANVHRLPRELSVQAQLTSLYVTLSRSWTFEDCVGMTSDKDGAYTVQRPLGTLKRYLVERLHISFEDGHLHFLDILLDSFRECFATAKARDVEVYGFSKEPSVYREEIDRIKQCLHLMEIQNELLFRFTELGQLDALFRDNSDFPKVEQLKIFLEKPDSDELPTGEALAETLWASRNHVLACWHVDVEVTGVSKPAPALSPILDVHYLDGAEYSAYQTQLKLCVHQATIEIIVITGNLAGEQAATIHVSAINWARTRRPLATSQNDEMPTYAEATADRSFFLNPVSVLVR